MTCVCSTYLCIAPEGFGLTQIVSYYIGLFCVLIAVVWFAVWKSKTPQSPGDLVSFLGIKITTKNTIPSSDEKIICFFFDIGY